MNLFTDNQISTVYSLTNERLSCIFYFTGTSLASQDDNSDEIPIGFS